MFSCCHALEKLKVIKELKHVRSKVSHEIAKESIKSSEEIVKTRCQILCDFLNCNFYTAREIIAKNKQIIKLNHNSFLQNANFIKNFFKLSDLIEYPGLLTLQPSLLQHRYFSLKELGFSAVIPSSIFRFSHVLKETPATLKQRGFPFCCGHKSDILNEYLIASNRTEVIDKLHHMYKDGSDLQKIRKMMNMEFFSAKLCCSIGKSYEMLHKHAALKVQSILYTDQLLNILLNKFNFSVFKIQSSVHLLSLHPEAAEQFLSEFPEILGVSTVFLAKRVPLLLKQDNVTIQEIEAILKDFNINKDQLTCCPKTLLIAPNTLKERLTTLCKTEDFAVLKSNKKFLWLTYYYNNLNSRFHCLKNENMPFSINVFTSSKKTFQKYLIYKNTRTCIPETYAFLSDVFKMTEKEIFNRLQHYSYVQSDDQKFSTLNCQRVIEYLLLHGVTKEQIFNGLEIVYYDINVVKLHFKRLKTHPHCQPFEDWSSHFNLIQLLIYTIEAYKYHSYDVELDEEEDFLMEYSN